MGAIMIWLTTRFGTGVFWQWVVRAALVGLGFKVVNLAALEGALIGLQNVVESRLLGAPSALVNIMGILDIDILINWIFYALMIRVAMKGLTRLIFGGIGS